MGQKKKHPEFKSREMVKKERMANLEHDGDVWTDAELDNFFHLWLSGRATNTICDLIGRTESAIETIRWKVVARYKGLAYTSSRGTNRIGVPFNERGLEEREDDLIKEMVAQGSWDWATIAVVLARKPEEVEARWAYLQNKQKTDKPLGFGLK